MQEFKVLRRKQSQEGDTGSKQEPVPVRAFNLMKMEATNVLFPVGTDRYDSCIPASGFACVCLRGHRICDLCCLQQILDFSITALIVFDGR